jgi:hypothetical protein
MIMNEALAELIRRSKGVNMTPVQEREQRVSFVFGNTNIENPRITRELVEEVESRLTGTPEKL